MAQPRGLVNGQAAGFAEAQKSSRKPSPSKPFGQRHRVLFPFSSSHLASTTQRLQAEEEEPGESVQTKHVNDMCVLL